MGIHSEIPSRNNAEQSVRSRHRHFWHQMSQEPLLGFQKWEMSQEPSLGFEPTSLRLSESAVQHSTNRATRVLRRRGRQSLTRRLPQRSGGSGAPRWLGKYLDSLVVDKQVNYAQWVSHRLAMQSILDLPLGPCKGCNSPSCSAYHTSWWVLWLDTVAEH